MRTAASFAGLSVGGLVCRLRQRGLNVKQQNWFIVRSEGGTTVGEYCADWLIENGVMAELKGRRDAARA